MNEPEKQTKKVTGEGTASRKFTETHKPTLNDKGECVWVPKADAPPADANADEFECEKCHSIRDIEDSIERGELLLCDDCASETREVVLVVEDRTSRTMSWLGAAHAKALKERDELTLQLGASLAREANEHSRAERLGNERDELLAACEYALTKILPGGVREALKAAIAKAEGSAE
jgi:hypothetical protein